MTNNNDDHNYGQNITEGKSSDNDMSQGEDPRNTSSPSEEETQGNIEEPNLRRSGLDRKPPSPYEPYFEGKLYGSQIFGMKMKYNMTTTNNLNSIAVNVIFSKVFNMYPSQEAPGAHKKMSFGRG